MHSNIDTEPARRFLKLLDPEAKHFTFQTFHDKKPATKPELAHVVESPAQKELLRLHADGAGIYVTVNQTDGKGRKAENATRIRAVFQEDDGGHGGPFPLEPSLIVETSPGHFHRYWLTDDWPADEQGRKDFAAVMERMVESYGSDKNAKDIVRVLRVPGFLHRKGDPHLVRIVEARGRRYTRDEILAAFPPVERKEKKEAPRHEWKPQGDDDRRIREALDRVGADDRYVWLQIGMALKDEYGDSGRGLWDDWSRRSEKYNERDQDKTWRSLRRNGVGIGTLFHHAKQAGWRGEGTRKHEPDSDDDKIIELSKLDPLKYGKIRKEEAKRLGVGVKALDDAVRGQQKEKKEQASFLPHWNNEPWPEPVAGDALLDALRAHLKRHVVLAAHTDVALALRVLHTWVFEAFDITPYLCISSPTRRCGKTLLMTLLYWLCQRAKKNDSMSKAAIYRSVDRDKPTLVLDEVGWVVDQGDERQSILCGGFERNGYAETCEGEGADITTKLWSTFCPKAFGLIGKLTATLMDRSIEIPMRRKLAEKVERLRRRDNDEHARLRRLCCRWAQDNIEALTRATPALPDKLNDRAADFWEPLLAVAAQAGGEWVKLATEAALALSDDGDGANEEKGVELLQDIRAAFRSADRTALTTKTLLASHLCADAERPWATWNKGKPITDRQVAKLLKEFRVISENVQQSETGEGQAKGYRLVRFEDAFRRYLPANNSVSPQDGGPGTSTRTNADGMGATSDSCVRPETNLDGCEKREKPASHAGSYAWTAKKAEPREEKFFGSNAGASPGWHRMPDDEPQGQIVVNGFAISATPEDRKPPEPGQIFVRVRIRTIRSPASTEPGDDLFVV